MKFGLLKKLFTKSTPRKSEKIKGEKIQGAEKLKKIGYGPPVSSPLNFFQFSEDTFSNQLFELNKFHLLKFCQKFRFGG